MCFNQCNLITNANLLKCRDAHVKYDCIENHIYKNNKKDKLG